MKKSKPEFNKAKKKKADAADIKPGTKKERDAENRISKRIVLAAVLSFAILAGTALTSCGGGTADNSENISDAASQGDLSEEQSAESSEAPHYISNMLAAFSDQYKFKDFKEIEEYIYNGNVKFMNLVNSEKIASLDFITDSVKEPSDYKGIFYTSADVSALGDSSVMAYVYEEIESDSGESIYYVYICADGVIYANPDSSYMFCNVGSKKMTELNLTGFDTSYVRNMLYMFAYCGFDGLSTLNLGDKFDTSNVTDMSYMFYNFGFRDLLSLNLGERFDTIKVTDMRNMFSRCGCDALTALNLGDRFDTSNVTDMSYMFHYFGSNFLTTLNLGDKFDTSNVTNMSTMFSSCGFNSLTALDLGDKFDTSNVTDMSNMFRYCGYVAMTTLDLGDKFNTSKVMDMSCMFKECGHISMTSLDLGAFGDISSVEYYGNILNSCGKKGCVVTVKSQTVKDWLINDCGYTQGTVVVEELTE